MMTYVSLHFKNFAHKSNFYLYLYICGKKANIKTLTLRTNNIVIAYDPDLTIPGVYVSTLVILVYQISGLQLILF